MRIAHVALVIYPVPPETYGGTERVIADLAYAQHELGYEVTAFASVDSRLEGIEVIGRYRSLTAAERDFDGRLPPGFPAELEAAQLADIARLKTKFDVIHLHGSAHASGICAALGVPTFRTIHWRADEPDHQLHFQNFPNERVIAISNRQAQDIPRNVLAGVVHHGIPINRYTASNSSGEYLTFIGRMTDQKRPDRAIALARSVGLPLRLAGPIDPGNPNYFAKVVVPYLDEKIIHLGSLTDARKQEFFADSLALVFPIDWPEPFGLVMIEAMACGVPVIAWDNGSVIEVVEDGLTGIVVNSSEEAEARFGEIHAIDRALVRNRFERRFSSKRMAQEVVRLYEEAGV